MNQHEASPRIEAQDKPEGNAEGNAQGKPQASPIHRITDQEADQLMRQLKRDALVGNGFVRYAEVQLGPEPEPEPDYRFFRTR